MQTKTKTIIYIVLVLAMYIPPIIKAPTGWTLYIYWILISTLALIIAWLDKWGEIP